MWWFLKRTIRFWQYISQELQFQLDKRDTQPLTISFSLAVNRWLSAVADSGPRGANWSDLWPLTLMEGVAGGQACKGYSLYPSPRTGAQSLGRHPARIGGSLGPPHHRHHIHMVSWAKEQTPQCTETSSCFDLSWVSLIFPRVPKDLMPAFAWIDEQEANIDNKNLVTISIIGDKFRSDPNSSSLEISVSLEVKTELILLSVKDL